MLPSTTSVEVHQGELDILGGGVGQHAEGPRVGLAEVAEAEEPEAGGKVLQRGADGPVVAPVQVGAPQREPGVAAARDHRTELLLEGLGHAQAGRHDPGRRCPVTVQQAVAHCTTPPAQPRQVRCRTGRPTGAAGCPSARVGLSEVSSPTICPPYPVTTWLAVEFAVHPVVRAGVGVKMDVHAAEEGPAPGVHDGGQRRLRCRVVPDAGTDGDLQDQGFQEPARLARVGGPAGVDEDLRGAVDLVGRSPAHTSLRMNSRRAASFPVQVCHPHPSYRCTPIWRGGAGRVAKCGTIRAT